MTVLHKIWEKRPLCRDATSVARCIIKSTDISFIGKSVETIHFKSDNFSFKLKKEAVKLLSEVAIIIQKYVRRYLVLLTSIHRAHKRALMLSPLPQHFTCSEDDKGEFPETQYEELETDAHSVPPRVLLRRSQAQSNVNNSKCNGSSEVEEAISVQLLAQKELSSSDGEGGIAFIHAQQNSMNKNGEMRMSSGDIIDDTVTSIMQLKVKDERTQRARIQSNLNWKENPPGSHNFDVVHYEERPHADEVEAKNKALLDAVPFQKNTSKKFMTHHVDYVEPCAKNDQVNISVRTHNSATTSKTENFAVNFHYVDKYFEELKDLKEMSDKEVMVVFSKIAADDKFCKLSSDSCKNCDKLTCWVEILIQSVLNFRQSAELVVAGLRLITLLPLSELYIAETKLGVCGIIGKVLSPHIESENICADILLFGVKFTSYPFIPDIDQATNSEGLEMILKVLLIYGQSRNNVGGAPVSVVNCLKYILNICIASSECMQERLIAAGVGDILLKMMVFYKLDEAAVGHVCRIITVMIRNTKHLNQFASQECICLYMLILKTTYTDKYIAKAVGLLLIDLHTSDPEYMKTVMSEAKIAVLLNTLLHTQFESSTTFRDSVIESNLMVISYFILQVDYLRDSFVEADIASTFRKYLKNIKPLGDDVEQTVGKCLNVLKADPSKCFREGEGNNSNFMTPRNEKNTARVHNDKSEERRIINREGNKEERIVPTGERGCDGDNVCKVADVQLKPIKERHGTREFKSFDDMLPPHLFDDYFNALSEYRTAAKEDVSFLFKRMESNLFFNQSTIDAVGSCEKLLNWVQILLLSTSHFKADADIVLAGLRLAAFFPYHKLRIPQHRINFCGIIGQLLSAHIDSEKICADILLFGVKFTSKDTVPNVEQAIDSTGLEMIVKVLLKYGQDRDAIGKAPASVVNCLKYVRNICVASTELAHERLMAAGVGSLLLKLFVFYKSDEAVVGPICRSVTTLIRNSLCMNQLASGECIRMYMLILQTTPTNNVIAKAVGLLLIGIHGVDAEASRSVFLKVNLASMVNDLLQAQTSTSSRYNLSVIESNLMTASYFIIQANYLKEAFVKVNIADTLRAYQRNRQNFGKNVDLVIRKCLKHMKS